MIVPMKAGLTLRRNDNPFRTTFVVRNEDGSVKDMSHLSARMQIRLYPGALGEPLIEATSADLSGSRLIMSATGIEAVFVRSDLDATPLHGRPGEPLTAHYDLLVTESGDENAWFIGPITVERGVTV